MQFSVVYNREKYMSSEMALASETESQISGRRTVTRKYRLYDLLFTQEITEYPGGGMKSLVHTENTGTRNSGTVTAINDFDGVLPFECDAAVRVNPDSAAAPAEDAAHIEACLGSASGLEDFRAVRRDFYGAPLTFSCHGGRSSDTWMPFFEARRKDAGYLVGLGWSGQWKIEFERTDAGIRCTAGVGGRMEFYLKPGEKIRTASVLVVPYGDPAEGHNAFRRILRKSFVRGGDEYAPFSLMEWGGDTSATMLRHIEDKKELGFEYYWLDAGWYGKGEPWYIYTGNWVVNAELHPDGLEQVFAASSAAGMHPLLWFEAERVFNNTPLLREHPEFVFPVMDPVNDGNTIIDLGDEKAQEWLIGLYSSYIERYGIRCLRIDFNIYPLERWEHYDEDGRHGINQLRYVMGLYRVWDALLAKYPDLWIDNCASGGRRIDLETCMRSAPLWRSDFQCADRYNPTGSQNNNMALSRWLPYSGTGFQRLHDDLYRFRSCYASGMNVGVEYEDEQGKYRAFYPRFKQYIEEYKSVRRYFACDYYEIFGFSVDETSWAGWQFHDPEDGSGIIQAFRRPACPSSGALVFPRGLREAANYRLQYADSGESATVSGASLMQNGLSLSLPERRSSLLIRYCIV